ncbi:uncharacterized protein LOC122632613 [Vespula pensylvanica]|nr:uncharacterized protein LOC122632613 [Vespula pensylvanica]
MKGGYLIIAAFAAVMVTVYAEDNPILPVPTYCPDVDPEDRTIHLAHEYDCTKFYKCIGGNKVELLCPFMDKAKTRRLHFNKVLQVCDLPARANCNSPAVQTTPRSKDEWTPEWTCGNRPVGTYLPHKTRCHLFYQCTSYGQVLQRCAEGLVFNPYAQVCDKSGKCVVTDVCKDYRNTEGSYLPDPLSCKNVYYCKEETTEKYSCDENAEWSTQSDKCLPADQANCSRKL